MKNSWHVSALIMNLALQLPTLARAQGTDYANPDRPGIADGSKVVGAGRAQIEIGLQEEFRNDGTRQNRRIFVPTLLRFGVSDRLEARIETNSYTWERSIDPVSGVTRSKGNTPISIGLKYQFADSDGIKHPSLGIIARVFPPSGSGNFRTDRTTGDIRLAADWDVAPKWSLNPNIGIGKYVDDSGAPYTAGLFALTLNFNPSKQLNLFVDVGGQTPETKNGQTSAIFDGGIAFMVTKDIQVDASIGTKISGNSSPHPFLAAGVSKRF